MSIREIHINVREHISILVGGSILLLFVIAAGVYIARTQMQASAEVPLTQTLHVFPGSIESSDFDNTDSLYFQDLLDSALLGDFNTENSAFIKGSIAVDGSTQQAESVSTTTDIGAETISTSTPEVTEVTATTTNSSTTTEEVESDKSFIDSVLDFLGFEGDNSTTTNQEAAVINSSAATTSKELEASTTTDEVVDEDNISTTSPTTVGYIFNTFKNIFTNSVSAQEESSTGANQGDGAATTTAEETPSETSSTTPEDAGSEDLSEGLATSTSGTGEVEISTPTTPEEGGADGEETDSEADEITKALVETPPPPPEEDNTPPTIEVLGNNPARIEINSEYNDLGAIITSEEDKNLGISHQVDGSVVRQIEIDTSLEGIHSILYSVTDTAGNIGYAERVVVVGNVEYVPVESEIVETAQNLEPVSFCEKEDESCNRKVIEFSDFGVTDLIEDATIKTAQLRLSFAGKSNADSLSEYREGLTIEYYYEGKWYTGGSLSLNGEVSNAINGGYYLYALPVYSNWTDLNELRVRITYESKEEKEADIYIDALWLELEIENKNPELENGDILLEGTFVEYREDLKRPDSSDLLSSSKLDFSASEIPKFNVKYYSQRNSIVGAVRNLFTDNLYEVEGTKLIHKGVGEIPHTVNVEYLSDGRMDISLSEIPTKLRPGKYEFSYTVKEGGKSFTDTFEFYWGVLAVNPTKSKYLPGEIATFHGAALNNTGSTICDADLELLVTGPTGATTSIMMDPSGFCNGNNVTDVPDYTATYSVGGSGSYQLKLSRRDVDGEEVNHVIDSFEVHNTLPFVVERIGPTRIYPYVPYDMNISIDANDAFSGKVIETVPSGFIISNTDANIVYTEEYIELIWDTSLGAGEKINLAYTFDAPDVSPFIYTVGPLQFVDETLSDLNPPTAQIPTTPSNEANVTDEEGGAVEGGSLIYHLKKMFSNKVHAQSGEPIKIFGTESQKSEYLDTRKKDKVGLVFKESREWKIASDVAGFMLIFWDNDSYTPSGWTCASCNPGEDYYERFLRGSSTAATSTSFGNATHTHSGTGNVDVAGGAGVTQGSGSGSISTPTHTHSFSPTIGATSSLPAYRQLRVLRSNSAGDPTSIPAGAILIFDASVPSGWTQYSSQNDYFVRGESTSGTTGGSNDHTHSASGTTGGASGSYGSAGSGVTAAANAHTHTVSTTTAFQDQRPPYIEVVLGSLDATSSPSDGIISMWDGDLPSGWTSESGTGGDFDGRFIVGSTTYGTTGGSISHAPSNITDAISSFANTTDSAKSGTGGVPDHTHTVDVTGFSTADNLPPYADVIIAKRLGVSSVFNQAAYRWFVNEDAEPPTDIWPAGAVDVEENEAISAEFEPLKPGEVIRLKVAVGVTNSTSTVGQDRFTLQFGEGAVCSAITEWTDVGQLASTTAWRGYDNPSLTDTDTLSSTTLSVSNVFGSYEETNNSTGTPVQIGVGDYAEYDWVIENYNATSGTAYCFRMIESDDSEFTFYTNYAQLITNYSPDASVLEKLFDNEQMASTSPWFEFKSFDSESEALHYQIQVDTDVNFASTDIDANSEDDEPSFSNIISESDKAPYNNNESIRFKATTTLSDDTTYWWRVRAKDPDGSNAYGDWSTPRSFTSSSTIQFSTWYQTTHDQFDTNTLSGVESVTNQLSLISGSTTGTTTSTEIDFDWGTIGNAWGEFSWNDTEPGGSTITYHIEYFTSTSSWAFIPDADLPGNDSGFGTSPVDLTNLNTATYNVIRIKADFIDAGTSPSIEDWSVSWSNRVSIPTLLLPFDNEKFNTTTPEFTFYSSDPDEDDLEYQISWSTTTDFLSSTTRTSSIDFGFENFTTSGDIDPFNSGDTVLFRIQPTDILNASTTYWWRTRAKDPLDSNTWSFWSNPFSFTTASSTENITVSTWYQDTEDQFNTDLITGFEAATSTVRSPSAGSVTYTFSGVTSPSGTHVARDFEVDVDDPTDPPGASDDIDSLTTTGTNAGTPNLRTGINGYNSDAEASTAQYSSIANSDDNRWTITDPGAGDNAVFWASFNIAEDPANISQIDVTLEGYQANGTDVAWLGIWEAGSTTPYWKELARSQQTTDFNYTGTVTTNLSDYIDTNGDLHLIFFNEDVNDSLIVDYVEVQITSNTATSGTIVATPIDFDDGDGPRWDEVSWIDYNPGTSEITYQLEYFTATSSWATIPDTDLSGNNSGFTTPPIDISTLDVDAYNQIRLTGDLVCDGSSNCPELEEWTVTWQPGITISGTAQEYDQTTNLTSGTVAVAVNGELQRWKTGTIAAGAWSISPVKAFAGDIITVFIDGAADSGEAVAVTKYATGTGDITNMELFERHLSIGSNQNATTTNTELSLFDFSSGGDEDVFFDVDAGNDLLATSTGSDNDVEVYIQSGDEHRLDSGSSGNLETHDVEINGLLVADGNTITLEGSWDNNGRFKADTSLVVFNATDTVEYIDSTGAATSTFNDVTLGQTSGVATWNNDSVLDINGNFTLDYGTFSASTSDVTLSGDLLINSNGVFSKGTATTTFDGSVAGTVTDNTATMQDLGTVAVDGSSKTLNLGSNIMLTDLTIGGDDTLNVSTSHYDITVLSGWINNNIFIAQEGEVIFATTSLGAEIDAGSSSFYDLTFEGDGGGWSFVQNDLDVDNNFSIASGTPTLAVGTTTIGGSLTTTDAFLHNNGTVLFDATSAGKTVTASTSPFYNLTFNGSGGAWSMDDTNATTSNNFAIDDGTVTLPAGTFAVGNSFTAGGGVINPNSGTVRLFATDSGNTLTLGGNDLHNLTFDGSGGAFAFTDTNATTTGTLQIDAGTATFPNGTLSVQGSFINSDSFSNSSGIVRFSSLSTGNTIDTGNSSFYDVQFDGVTGGWTVLSPATSTNNFAIQNADTFVASADIEVQGEFTNQVENASTTWTGSTLYLNSGTDYSINTKTSDGDSYDTLLLGINTDIDMWNSTSTVYDIDSTSSLYSQDHNGVNGELYIFGDYERVSGTEYWSAATDFDGADLTGSERSVSVLFDANASALFDSSTLQILGTSTGTTTVDRQGASNYSVVVGDGSTINAQYYSFNNLDINGLILTGSPTITSMDDGEFELTIDGGSTITMGGTVIDANPLFQIERNQFSTTTAITGSNVTATGTPSSFVWFRNHYGNLDGEDFDTDTTPNPGNVRWDDSVNSVNISGFVYESDGTTVSSVCGAGSPVTVIVDGDGGTPYTGACNGGDGSFSIAGVGYLGDPVFTIYLNTGGAEKAVTVTRTPTVDIADMYLYEDTVIIRHEDTNPLSIANMSVFDSNDDADIPFVAEDAVPDTLTIEPDTELFIWSEKTFVPGGDITINSGGSGLDVDGSFVAGTSTILTFADGEDHSIGGSFIMDTTTIFDAASTTLTFTATTTGKTFAATSTIAQIVFNGSGGEWDIASSTTISGDITLNAGTMVGSGDVTVEGGDILGNGDINMSGGTFTASSTGQIGGATDWTFSSLTLGDGVSVATTTKVGAGSIEVTGVLTIDTNHTLDASNSSWELSGSGTPFVIVGTFDSNTSTFIYSGSAATNISTTTYNILTLAATAGSPTYTIQTGTLNVLGDFTIGDGTNNTTVTAILNDPAISVTGTTTINTLGTFTASDSQTYREGASWLNYGTFNHSNGTLLFNAGSVGHLVRASTSPFFNVDFINSAGGWTIAENATATNNFNITDVSSFAVPSSVTLAVQGQFYNGVGGANTTWTDSTLYLDSGTNYTINTKSLGGDAYAGLLVGDDTDVRFWNSSFANGATTSESASIYSQDHATNNGDLYIWGDYVRSSGSDYWSYATDFDGTDISGTPRRADVYLAENSTTTLSGDLLQILGGSTASTTIQNQGSGTYALEVTGGTLNAKYYTVRDIGVSGINISGTPTITDLSNGDFLLEIDGGSTITVAGATIDANNGNTFTDNIFATSSAIGGSNVTATGASIGSWRFDGFSGNLSGEAFDTDPGGDPGYIIWVGDSNTLITVEGTVYTDEGLNTAGGATCNGTNQTVVMLVEGSAPVTTSCDGSGDYSFSNVLYDPGDVIAIYLDADAGATFAAATITVDPLTTISNMDLYQDRVIVRHEDTNAITNSDLSVCDASACDSDIPFDVTGSDLVTEAGTELHIWTGKEYAPGGNVTLHANAGAEPDGTLHVGESSTFTAAGSETHTIGGSFNMMSGGTFEPANSTITMNATTTGKIISATSSPFYNLTFSGSGGSWSFPPNEAEVTNDMTISAGTVTLGTATTTVGGSFDNTGGSFVHNNGLVLLSTTTVGHTIEVGGSDFYDLTLSGSGGGWTFQDTNATTTNDFLITSASTTLPSGTFTVGGSFENDGGVFNAPSGTVRFSSVGAETVFANGSSFAGMSFDGGGGTWTIIDENATSTGDFEILSGTVTLATGTLAIAESFDNSGGSFVSGATTTVRLYGSGGSETINTNGSLLTNLVIDGSGGTWTLTGDATTTNDFDLLNAAGFTASGFVEVQGEFINLVGGANTTWTSSTLYIRSDTNYSINTKVAGGDSYEELIVGQTGTGTDIRLWNSTSTIYTTVGTSSIYSQDHNSANGDLYIFGEYERSSGEDYWSYATDFDGTDISGSPRQVEVYMDSTATTTLSGGTLNIVGVSSATTTVQNQGGGEYGLEVTGGTFNASYYQLRNMNGPGLNLSGASTVISSLSNGDFELSVEDGSMLSVTSVVIDNNASLQINDTGFATSSGISSGYNGSVSGSASNGWSFNNHYGNYDGEDYDDDGLDDCGALRWDDSTCLFVSQEHFRWRNDDGGEAVPTNLWFNAAWDKRKKVAITDRATTTSTNLSVKIDVTYDSDMQSDFDDVRFTDSSGTTSIDYWRESYVSSDSAVFWVEVPELQSLATTDIFMYYDNAVATDASSGTSTFIAFDDFEDNDLDEYEGDLSSPDNFDTLASMNYEGSYGVGAQSGQEGVQTTDGIYGTTTPLLVSQGETIRFFQYVVATSDDEPCFLFAVQSPGSDNENYAVCLDPYDDEVTLTADVSSDDESGTTTPYGVEAVTYTTTWYEVEIDWETDGTIFVSVYDDGTLFATTTGSNSTYTTGAIGFSFWAQNGGWDLVSSRKYVAAEPSYTFGVEQVDSGATWATTEDTALVGADIGDLLRLRFTVNNTGGPITNQNFRLQYAAKGAALSCESVPGGSFADIPTDAGCGASHVCMATSSNFTNLAATTELLSAPSGSTFTSGQIVEDSSIETGDIDVGQNEFTEVEYAFKMKGTVSDSNYCFRTTDGGTALDDYPEVAEINLTLTPILTNYTLNSRQDIVLVPGGTTTVYATGTAIDLNGYGDLDYATTTIYYSGESPNCAEDDNTCYQVASTSCSFYSCAGNSCELSCQADMVYHATATDSIPADEWLARMTLADIGGAKNTEITLGVDVLTLRAIEASSSIPYGSLYVGSTTEDYNATTTISNIGNDVLDLNLSGSSLTFGPSTITADYQKYATSSFTYSGCGAPPCSTLSGTPSSYEVDLGKPTSSTTAVYDQLFWGIEIPTDTAAAAHEGTNTFTAVGD